MLVRPRQHGSYMICSLMRFSSPNTMAAIGMHLMSAFVMWHYRAAFGLYVLKCCFHVCGERGSCCLAALRILFRVMSRTLQSRSANKLPRPNRRLRFLFACEILYSR